MHARTHARTHTHTHVRDQHVKQTDCLKDRPGPFPKAFPRVQYVVCEAMTSVTPANQHVGPTEALRLNLQRWTSDKNTRCFTRTDANRTHVWSGKSWIVNISAVQFKYCEFGLRCCAFYRRWNRDSIRKDLQLLRADFKRRQRQLQALWTPIKQLKQISESYKRNRRYLKRILKYWDQPQLNDTVEWWRQITIATTQRLRRRYLLQYLP